MQDERTRVGAARSALVDALAGEHRLRRQALKEQQEAGRWRQRVSYAEERGLADLAEAARARAARHTRTAGLLAERADEMQAEVRLLREALEATRGAGRAPPRDPLEARFADLEIEAELDRIRAGPPGGSAPVQRSEGS